MFDTQFHHPPPSHESTRTRPTTQAVPLPLRHPQRLFAVSERPSFLGSTGLRKLKVCSQKLGPAWVTLAILLQPRPLSDRFHSSERKDQPASPLPGLWQGSGSMP